MYRRTRGDMIEVFKILTGKYDINVTFSIGEAQLECYYTLTTENDSQASC